MIFDDYWAKGKGEYGAGDQAPGPGPINDTGPVEPYPPAAPPPVAGGTTAPVTAGSVGGGGNPFDYVGQNPYTGPDAPQLPGVPQFRPPEFVAPTAESVLSDPGYQFRLNQGEQALNASAAARGVLRTGGTLKDILGYGQNYASQEYGNAYDRAVRDYGLRYQAAKDIFAPRLLDYQSRVDAANAAYQQLWQRYMFGVNDELQREQLMAGITPPQ